MAVWRELAMAPLVCAALASASIAGEAGPTSNAEMTIRLHLTPHIDVTSVGGPAGSALEICMQDRDFVGRIVSDTRTYAADDCGTQLTIEAKSPRRAGVVNVTVVPE